MIGRDRTPAQGPGRFSRTGIAACGSFFLTRKRREAVPHFCLLPFAFCLLILSFFPSPQ
jgi:hypothetical protein